MKLLLFLTTVYLFFNHFLLFFCLFLQLSHHLGLFLCLFLFSLGLLPYFLKFVLFGRHHLFKFNFLLFQFFLLFLNSFLSFPHLPIFLGNILLNFSAECSLSRPSPGKSAQLSGLWRGCLSGCSEKVVDEWFEGFCCSSSSLGLEREGVVLYHSCDRQQTKVKEKRAYLY